METRKEKIQFLNNLQSGSFDLSEYKMFIISQLSDKELLKRMAQIIQPYIQGVTDPKGLHKALLREELQSSQSLCKQLFDQAL